MYGINMNDNIIFKTASLRYFQPQEHHVTRICPDNVLLMIFDGILRFEEDGVAFALSKGQWHIQKQNSYQTATAESNEPKYLYVHFDADWILSDTALPLDGTFSVKEFLPLMEELDRLRYSNATQIEINAVFYTILVKLFNTPVKKSNSIAHKALELLTENLSNSPTLDEVALKLNYSKNHIIRLVKKEYGCTPYAYLIDYKLKYSLQLLESTSLPILEISEACGFCNYSVFFKFFKTKYSISPRGYREKICR